MSCCNLAILPTPLVLPLATVECDDTTTTDYSIEAGLFYYLTNHPQVSCLIADRVFPGYVPRDVEEAEYPCITYEISDQPVEAITGQSGATTASIDLDCWAPSFDTSARLAEAVRKSMQGFRGWFGNVAVVGCWYQGYDGTTEEPRDNSSVYWFARTLTFNVTYLVPIHSF